MAAAFPRKILVATDFSEASKTALRQGVALREKTKAEITLVHTLEDLRSAIEQLPAESRWKLVQGNIEEYERDLRRKTDEKLQEFLKSESITGVQTKTLIGKAGVELIHEVHAGGYDLLIAGTVGNSVVHRLFVGSVAEQLLRNCPIPVWVTRPGHEVAPRKILVPIDFSEVSDRIAKIAGEIAVLFDSALLLVHAYDNQALVLLGLLDGETSENSELLAQSIEEEVRPKLIALQKDLPGGLQVETRILSGEASQVINHLQEPEDVDLTVMGSNGRSGVSGLLLGNTAEKVLRHSNSSLLVVKPANFVSPIGPALVK